MIKSLYISNYALIDSIEIDFTDGLNIITGETGAGKSVMLSALGLILGARADFQVVGDINKKSVIEAVFELSPTPFYKQLFESNDVEWDQDNIVTLRREISGSRSRAFINDTPVRLEQLQNVSSRLVDIHSQHQNALLSDADFQLDVIDSLSKNEEVVAEYTVAYKSYRQSLKEYHETKRRLQRNRIDQDFLRYQLSQLDKLGLQTGEKERLEKERDEIASLSEVKNEIDIINDAASQRENSVTVLLDVIIGHIQSISHLLNPDDDIVSRLESMRVEFSDISETFEALSREINVDPQDLDVIDSRLMEISALEERHDVASADDLIRVQESIKSRLDELDDAEITLAELEKRARRAKAKARDLASRLTKSRVTQAKILEDRLRTTASPLGMPNLQVQISVSSVDLGPTGADKVEFLFAFNKNQKLVPVKGAASGGEISRLMLSLKAIIANTMALPTIIFDEVDTGVSGDVANRMGIMMTDIAKSIQVIAITHLPQVAAKGKSHYKVFKYDDDSATHTYIKPLDSNGRVDELALMLSGSSENEAARKTAIDLLSSTH